MHYHQYNVNIARTLFIDPTDVILIYIYFKGIKESLHKGQ